ncbi:MAG: enoyl-CoA hydratase/isomerase family protein [Gammaproteobacteria bacterium]|nr:enoyl-CoA hydratase/isomerase family protein [Gammaproteobacteria bacterium]
MIETIKHEHITELRLDRPPVNALNLELVEALTESHREAVRNKAQAIVISGKEGMFSGGLDVPELVQQSRNTMTVFWDRFMTMCRTLAGSPVPVIAAITGHSPAGGAVIALHCDYRVAVRGDFRMGLNEVQVGLALPAPIHAVFEFAVGARQATLLAMQGALLPMEQALQIGMVDELADVTEVVPRALEFARELTSLPPESMNYTRLAAKPEILTRPLESAEIRALTDAWFSEETQSTMRALVASLGK